MSTARDLDRFYRALLRSPLGQSTKTQDTYGYGLFKVQASCGWFWGHDGVVPGYMAQAYTDGRRSAVVLVTGDERTERQNAAINRAIDRALCS